MRARRYALRLATPRAAARGTRPRAEPRAANGGSARGERRRCVRSSPAPDADAAAHSLDDSLGAGARAARDRSSLRGRVRARRARRDRRAGARGAGSARLRHAHAARARTVRLAARVRRALPDLWLHDRGVPGRAWARVPGVRRAAIRCRDRAAGPRARRARALLPAARPLVRRPAGAGAVRARGAGDGRAVLRRLALQVPGLAGLTFAARHGGATRRHRFPPRIFATCRR